MRVPIFDYLGAAGVPPPTRQVMVVWLLIPSLPFFPAGCFPAPRVSCTVVQRPV